MYKINELLRILHLINRIIYVCVYYFRFDNIFGSLLHFTLIFNTFVFCQVFNFLNARKIHDEINVFKGIFDNIFFVIIVSMIAIIQVLIGNLGGIPFSVSFHGMDIRHWLIAIAFGAFGLIWGYILKVIPINKLCPKAGNKMTDPFHSSSKIMSIKRSHNEETLQRKFSSLNKVDHKGGSLSQIQHHAIGR